MLCASFFSFASAVGNPCTFVLSVFVRMSVFVRTPYFFVSLQQHFELVNYFGLFFHVFSNAVGCSSYMQDWPTYRYYLYPSTCIVHRFRMQLPYFGQTLSICIFDFLIAKRIK